MATTKKGKQTIKTESLDMDDCSWDKIVAPSPLKTVVAGQETKRVDWGGDLTSPAVRPSSHPAPQYDPVPMPPPGRGGSTMSLVSMLVAGLAIGAAGLHAYHTAAAPSVLALQVAQLQREFAALQGSVLATRVHPAGGKVDAQQDIIKLWNRDMAHSMGHQGLDTRVTQLEATVLELRYGDLEGHKAARVNMLRDLHKEIDNLWLEIQDVKHFAAGIADERQWDEDEEGSEPPSEDEEESEEQQAEAEGGDAVFFEAEGAFSDEEGWEPNPEEEGDDIRAVVERIVDDVVVPELRHVEDEHVRLWGNLMGLEGRYAKLQTAVFNLQVSIEEVKHGDITALRAATRKAQAGVQQQMDGVRALLGNRGQEESTEHSQCQAE